MIKNYGKLFCFSVYVQKTEFFQVFVIWEKCTEVILGQFRACKDKYNLKYWTAAKVDKSYVKIKLLT